MTLRVDQKKLTWRVPMDELERLNRAMLERIPYNRRNFQSLMDELIRQWLYSDKADPAPGPREREVADLAVSLMHSENRQLWAIVENALKIWQAEKEARNASSDDPTSRDRLVRH